MDAGAGGERGGTDERRKEQRGQLIWAGDEVCGNWRSHWSKTVGVLSLKLESLTSFFFQEQKRKEKLLDQINEDSLLPSLYFISFF